MNENNGYYNNSDNNGNANEQEEIIVPIITYNEVQQPKELFAEVKPVQVQQTQPPLYRWSAHSGKNSAAAKKSKSQLKLKIFAAVMAVLFLLTAASATALLVYNQRLINDPNRNLPVISNDNTKPEVDKTVAAGNDDDVIQIPDGNKLSGKELTTPEVIEKVKPSVVCIQAMSTTTYFGRTMEAPSTGTGFILTEDGYIATNQHVIENATKVTVILGSGEEYEAQIIGSDSVSDLAVLKINAENLPEAELGDSNYCIEGEDVVAIGSPGGIEFAGTTTKGIISAINRKIEVTSAKGYTTKSMSVLQTDASINPGNSGGPLVNSKGQVIGINTMKLSSGYEGMGFAIPISGAIPILNDLIQNKSVTSSYDDNFITMTQGTKLGISGYTVEESEAAEKNIPLGFKIETIEEGGPCDGIGLIQGDIIIAYDGTTIKSFEDLSELKQKNKVGDIITVTVYRNGDTYDFKVTLAIAD